jgi:hypothetical protein
VEFTVMGEKEGRREGGREGGRDGMHFSPRENVLLYPPFISPFLPPSLPLQSLSLSFPFRVCLLTGVQNRMDLNERIAEAEAREEEGREEAGDGQVFVVTEPVKTKAAADVVEGKAEGEEEVHSHHLRGGPAAH